MGHRPPRWATPWGKNQGVSPLGSSGVFANPRRGLSKARVHDDAVADLCRHRLRGGLDRCDHDGEGESPGEYPSGTPRRYSRPRDSQAEKPSRCDREKRDGGEDVPPNLGPRRAVQNERNHDRHGERDHCRASCERGETAKRDATVAGGLSTVAWRRLRPEECAFLTKGAAAVPLLLARSPPPSRTGAGCRALRGGNHFQGRAALRGECRR